jgi:2-C-methyl-D-erythritol 4-phosphate cytidylyltransferase
LPAQPEAGRTPIVAIVVAAGLGRRFGGTKPKPLLRILGKTSAFLAVEGLAAGGVTDAVVVINGALGKAYKAALRGLPIPVKLVAGGDSRQQSVTNGMRAISEDPHLNRTEMVLIHDAVRPLQPAFVTEGVVSALVQGAQAVAPAIPVVDTIRQDVEGGNALVDRNTLHAIQTPQGLAWPLAWECYRQLAEQGQEFTDDVSCLEHFGHKVVLVPGSKVGMKITEPADLTIAKALVKVRAGVGHHSGKRLRRFFRR